MAGNVWTLDQIEQVRGLYARAHLDSELEDRSGGAASRVARDKMTRKLIDMAHPFAVEPHPEDFAVIAERSDAHPRNVVLTCAWRPTTNAAILRGGPRDGERWAMQRVGDPFVVEWITGTPWLDADATHAEAAITTRTITYELAGWHETERCWVYEPRP